MQVRRNSFLNMSDNQLSVTFQQEFSFPGGNKDTVAGLHRQLRAVSAFPASQGRLSLHT